MSCLITVPKRWPTFFTHAIMPSGRREFRRNVGIDKRDFSAIEFLLRKGRRQLEGYSAPDIKDIQ